MDPNQKRLDEFCLALGVELSEHQKQIILNYVKNEKYYICYPPMVGRTNSRMAYLAAKTILFGGETDNGPKSETVG